MIVSDYDLALVLSGGNALGAYQAGAYEVLHEAGMEPGHVAGASIGAINGAIISGNPSEARMAALRGLWNPASIGSGRGSAPPFEVLRRTMAAMSTVAMGLPHMFVPRHLYGPWWNPFANPEPPSLYDSSAARQTFARLIDFEYLNGAGPRFTATAVDIETGEDIAFDTSTQRLGAVHLRASTALVPAFSPVEIDGRMLVDPGLSMNMPLDIVLANTPNRPLLCIALDLLPLVGPRPQSLGDAIIRAQDLTFATQTRRAIATWQALYEHRTLESTQPIILVHLSYTNHRREISGKAFDFSSATVAERWAHGKADMAAALTQLTSLDFSPQAAGLTVYTARRDDAGYPTLVEVHHSLLPTSSTSGRADE